MVNKCMHPTEPSNEYRQFVQAKFLTGYKRDNEEHCAHEIIKTEKLK